MRGEAGLPGSRRSLVSTLQRQAHANERESDGLNVGFTETYRWRVVREARARARASLPLSFPPSLCLCSSPLSSLPIFLTLLSPVLLSLFLPLFLPTASSRTSFTADQPAYAGWNPFLRLSTFSTPCLPTCGLRGCLQNIHECTKPNVA